MTAALTHTLSQSCKSHCNGVAVAVAIAVAAVTVANIATVFISCDVCFVAL